MLDRKLAPRVEKLEERFTTLGRSVDDLRTDVGGLTASVGGMVSKLDRLFDVVGATKEDGAARAVATEDRMRNTWSNWLKGLLAVVALLVSVYGAIYMTVSGFTGPMVGKIDQVSDKVNALSDALSGKVAGLGEVASRQGADVGTLKDRADIQRERNDARDAELREHDQDLAFLHGYLNARIGAPGR